MNHITDHSRGGGGGGGGGVQQQQGIMIPLSTGGCEDHWSWNKNDKSDEVGLLFQFILQQIYIYIYQIFSTNYSL